MTNELHRAGFDFTAKRVDTRADFVEALEGFEPDVLPADRHLPDFSGAGTLAGNPGSAAWRVATPC
jgi:hypothetical protein